MTNIFPVLHLETSRVHNSLFEKQETVLKKVDNATCYAIANTNCLLFFFKRVILFHFFMLSCVQVRRPIF